MMKIAIPIWQGRVSPVFDVAGRILIVETVSGFIRNRCEIALTDENPRTHAAALTSLNVGVLVCGAISWPFEVALSAAGVRVISMICGDAEAVLTAFLNGELEQGGFKMPGCHVQQQRTPEIRRRSCSRRCNSPFDNCA